MALNNKYMNIEQFNPTVAELTKMALVAQSITKEMGLDIVKENKTILQKTRTAITTKGKELREEALGFQRTVIAKEKELLEIISPEEDRLKAIEEEFKVEKVKEERLQWLPEFKEKLLSINGETWATDEEILGMDSMQFSIFYNGCVVKNLEKEQAKLREEQAKLDEEKNKIAREQELREAEERGKIQAQKDLGQKETLAKQEKEATERKIAEEKVKEEKRLAEEAKKLEDSVKYQNFLRKCGVDGSGDFEIKDNGKEVRVYKLVDVYTK